MKIVEIQKIVPKTRHLLKFGGHFEKSALPALSSTGIFAGNLISIALWLRFPKIVVSKNPPGGAGFRLLAHRLDTFYECYVGVFDFIEKALFTSIIHHQCTHER